MFSFAFAYSASVHAHTETNSEILTKIWETGRQKSCSPEMRSRFDRSSLLNVQTQVKSKFNRNALARALNPFLFSLGYSHTQFFSDQMESYYLFKGYYSQTHPSAPSAPLIVNPGIQVGSDDQGFFAREVLDGLPAKKRILKGDRLLLLDGKPFRGTWGVQAKQQASLRISRQGTLLDLILPLPVLNWSQAFQDATLKSIKTLTHRKRVIGYVRLWSGVHPDSASALWTAVSTLKAAHVEGLVLDLRGGYGGAFWEHLDPFFSDRKDFFEMSATDGDNQTVVMRAEPKSNPDAYLGPMVVLINEGSRSGKEALAYQFKKSKRAKLVGTSTPGYFSGGELFFLDQSSDYFLYLCVRRDSLLDGNPIEGIGIKPDVVAEFQHLGSDQDAQLKAALDLVLE